MCHYLKKSAYRHLEVIQGKGGVVISINSNSADYHLPLLAHKSYRNQVCYVARFDRILSFVFHVYS